MLAREGVGLDFKFKVPFGSCGKEIGQEHGDTWDHTVWATHHWPNYLECWAFDVFQHCLLSDPRVTSDSGRVWGQGTYRNPAHLWILALAHRGNDAVWEGWWQLPAISFRRCLPIVVLACNQQPGPKDCIPSNPLVHSVPRLESPLCCVDYNSQPPSRLS